MTPPDLSRGRDRAAVAAWCLYDWGNSAFNTLIATFVFSVYFTKAVAPDEVEGTRLWGLAFALSGAAVAVLSPALGAIADRAGRLKPWLATFTAICVVGTAALWWVRPETSSVLPALVAVGIASLGFELAGVFYNAMLPRVAPASHLGRVSGWGWGVGYFGGLTSLAACLLLLVQPETPLFGLLGREDQAHIRASAWLVAGWYALFCLPLFLLVPDRPVTAALPAGTALRAGLATLARTLRGLPRHPDVLRFLIASALWRDGINTITAFGGIYAASTFGMTTQQILLFAILLNVTAGLGSLGFAWMDDRLGPRPTIFVSLVGLFLSGGALLLVGTPAWDWAGDPGLPLAAFTGPQQWLLLLGLGLGLFFGPAQAAGRSMMARLAPPGLETEMFGLYALTGRAVSFAGPALYALAVSLFATQRAGLATTLVFFVLGGLVLATVRDPVRRS